VAKDAITVASIVPGATVESADFPWVPFAASVPVGVPADILDYTFSDLDCGGTCPGLTDLFRTVQTQTNPPRWDWEVLFGENPQAGFVTVRSNVADDPADYLFADLNGDGETEVVTLHDNGSTFNYAASYAYLGWAEVTLETGISSSDPRADRKHLGVMRVQGGNECQAIVSDEGGGTASWMYLDWVCPGTATSIGPSSTSWVSLPLSEPLDFEDDLWVGTFLDNWQDDILFRGANDAWMLMENSMPTEFEVATDVTPGLTSPVDWQQLKVGRMASAFRADVLFRSADGCGPGLAGWAIASMDGGTFANPIPISCRVDLDSVPSLELVGLGNFTPYNGNPEERERHLVSFGMYGRPGPVFDDLKGLPDMPLRDRQEHQNVYADSWMAAGEFGLAADAIDADAVLIGPRLAPAELGWPDASPPWVAVNITEGAIASPADAVFGDFDGDGRLDYMLRDSATTVSLAMDAATSLVAGNQFNPPQQVAVPVGFSLPSAEDIRVGSFLGTAVDQILWIDNGGSGPNMYQVWNPAQAAAPIALTAASHPIRDILAADFDADGVTDLLSTRDAPAASGGIWHGLRGETATPWTGSWLPLCNGFCADQTADRIAIEDFDSTDAALEIFSASHVSGEWHYYDWTPGDDGDNWVKLMEAADDFPDIVVGRWDDNLGVDMLRIANGEWQVSSRCDTPFVTAPNGPGRPPTGLFGLRAVDMNGDGAHEIIMHVPQL